MTQNYVGDKKKAQEKVDEIIDGMEHEFQAVRGALYVLQELMDSKVDLLSGNVTEREAELKDFCARFNQELSESFCVVKGKKKPAIKSLCLPGLAPYGPYSAFVSTLYEKGVRSPSTFLGLQNAP